MKDFFKESDFCATETKVGFDRHSNYPRYACEIANRLIRERGKVVRSRGGELWDALVVYPEHIHTAILLNIEPIEQDSAEKILRDMISWHDMPYRPESYDVTFPFIDRAKALLERERGKS